MKIQALQVGALGTNCYLLEDQGFAAVIDPGGDAQAIIRSLDDAQVTAILLTHGHDDHVGGVADLLARYPGAKLYIHKGDFGDLDPRLFPLARMVPESAVTFYDEGDTVSVGGLTVEVLHTPGHSEGSVTLRCGDLLFCGDTLFAGSCGRTDFQGGSTEKIMDSLRRLGQLEGNLRVLPGHMGDSTLDQERQRNPYLRHALRNT